MSWIAARQNGQRRHKKKIRILEQHHNYVVEVNNSKQRGYQISIRCDCQIMCHLGLFGEIDKKNHGTENGAQLQAEKTYLEFIAWSKTAFTILAVLIILAFFNYGADGTGSHHGKSMRR